ncbi:amidase family protein [Paenibacillus crassostreae]|nr:amidase family protein [Paenibacillus crassostreae]
MMRTISSVLTSILMLAPLATPIHAANATTSQSTEITSFLAQDWTPKDFITSSNGKSVVTSTEFVNLLNTAADAAGYDQDIAYKSGDVVTRETAAVLLDQIIDVPYSQNLAYNDVKSSSYLPSIEVISTSGLIKGFSDSRYGYEQTLTKTDAAVIAYRLYQYLQPFNPVEASITSIQSAMETGRLTSEELVQLYLDRIEQYDDNGPKLNSIIKVNDQAISLAKELDAERSDQGSRGPLHGIPIILKDNFDTADMPTTGGSLALKDSVPADDAYQVKKLREAGAIILAKANLHEFAFGYTTTSSISGQTLNPYNLTRVPGGSSGGTGASIAASFATVGMGSDTGGSIRVPSSFNNLVGIRPTIGLSSRDGIMPLALTQDTGGPIARTVADAAAVLDATVGYDPNDVTTASSIGNIPDSYLDYLDSEGLKGARIGIVRDVFGTDSEINTVMTNAIQELKQGGATLIDNVSIPNFTQINSFGSLSAWEFKFQFNDYLTTLGDNRPYSTLSDIITTGLFDPSIAQQLKDRNNIGSLEDETYKDIVLYRTRLAQQAILKMMADNDLDALIFPTSAKQIVKIDGDQTIGDGFKLSSFTGYPTVTVPAGFTTDNMPVGMDFIGRPFSEPTLIKLAYSFEQSTQHRRTPVLTP